MKNIVLVTVIVAVFCCLNIYLSYAEGVLVPPPGEIQTFDVNYDGKPDVTYHGDGKYVTKVEADTNFDGKPDITIQTKEGKFASAEIDTNYDGKADKKITDVKEFNQWVNKNHPQFNDTLKMDDGIFYLKRW